MNMRIPDFRNLFPKATVSIGKADCENVTARLQEAGLSSAKVEAWYVALEWMTENESGHSGGWHVYAYPLSPGLPFWQNPPVCICKQAAFEQALVEAGRAIALAANDRLLSSLAA